MQCTRLLCVTSIAVIVALTSLGPVQAKDRSYAAGNWALTLDGMNCGSVKSVAGGAIGAEVIQEPAGPSYFVKKHIGQPRYEAFTVQVGFSQATPLHEWISQSWMMKYSRKSGSVVELGYDLHPISERQFQGALLTEVTIPAMDGASKEPAYMAVTFTPAAIRVVKPTGQAKDYAEYSKTAQGTWLPANFRLEIAGLDCTRVTKIDAFTVKQVAVTSDIGGNRDLTREPGRLEFPNLKITLAESGAQSFSEWHQSFVVQGNCGEDQEKNGSLTLLSPTQQVELVRIKFFNMGIFRMQPAKAEAYADQVRRVTAELYVERMEFEYLNKPAPSDTAATAPATAPITTPTIAPPTTIRR